jgi:three-Cys-motif partner protein
MSKNIHNEEFDDSTLAKLYIYESFLKKWLGVFTAAKTIHFKTLNIFDYFAGPGTDSEGNIGSPLITVKTIPGYENYIIKNNIRVNLFFNEFSTPKYNSLVKNINAIEYKSYINADIQKQDFKVIFDTHYNLMKDANATNFVFLDQNGVKQITFEVFDRLINLGKTDFMFFISTSYLKRFMKEEPIRKYFDITDDFFDKTPHYHIHRKVTELYKERIPKEKAYYLTSFTLKKSHANIYGLIFGSNNPKGLERFLFSAWELDKERGEANFDIDEEGIQKGQMDLFTNELRKPNKLEKFEDELKTKLLNGDIKSDKELYVFTLQSGFLPNKHSKKILKELIKEQKILNKDYKYSYDAFRNPIKIELAKI